MFVGCASHRNVDHKLETKRLGKNTDVKFLYV